MIKTKKRTTNKTVSKKKSTAAKGAKRNVPRVISPKERWHMISVAAFYRAEKRSFTGGDPAEDWRQAEAEIDKLLRKQDTVVKP